MQWDGALCRWYLQHNKDFLNSLSYTTGLWTENHERYVDNRLEIEKREKSQYHHLTFSDIKEGLKHDRLHTNLSKPLATQVIIPAYP